MNSRDDFSDAMLALLDRELPNRGFDAGGGEALTMNQIVECLADAMKRSVRPLHLPKALFVQLARIAPDFDPDLIAAVDEDEVTDNDDFQEATGVICRPFNRGVRCLI